MKLNSCLVILFSSFVLHGYSQQRKAIYKDTAFISAMLKQHNTYRSALQLPELSWNPALAADALAWGEHLADIDNGQHDMSVRGKEGENLWWGTAGDFSYVEMVDKWGSEQSVFRYGVFPNVNTTKSAMVGHYTQIVWKNTTSVGCALVSNGKMDYLVCRYNPPGNIIGEKPY